MLQQSLRTNDDIERVFQKYADMIYRLAFSQTQNQSDADDVFQEVFLRYMKHGNSFESEEHEKAWLIRVTINCSRKLWSSAWFRHTVELNEAILFEMPEENEVYRALLQLPQKYRAVIHLFYYEDLPVAKIAQTLGMKESAVRTRLTRARELLRTKLKGDFDDV
ncbi:MAG TPA: sigma-70 family RNA polymerase sigma factor [Oscillospiraceae bacterium]|nr:sigma-70 family RNA polymerase sigma factor [Oscillospiraceae bacterium]